MSAAREEILARIREALRDVPDTERPSDVEVPRAYEHTRDEPRETTLRRFEERVRDYRAHVRRIPASEIAAAVALACSEMQVRSLVIPPELPAAWRPVGIELTEDDQLPAHELDGIDGALTGCATAIAETGTLVLDGSAACGRRAITLVPDHHICVVNAAQVVALVPEGMARVAPGAGGERAGPLTLISGPSASSDIELVRVEGVHGPRHLLVLIVDDSGPSAPPRP